MVVVIIISIASLVGLGLIGVGGAVSKVAYSASALKYFAEGEPIRASIEVSLVLK
ncbi:hypothetical protein MM239_20260 [Belliella sp. DSM 111904]|uniref:Uncharacterized protein n=1 Tax=Belliella filtrata TaxID=2923435 RepID=A0ABS9V5N2_9BACT|nr:hypothetical protein [Belliella filtrata]MCH7411732.1 hypothetical protein [Belliella filtrata]